MTSSITVSLPTDMKEALENLARKEGVQTDRIVGQALKEHLFLRQFRLLRDRMSAQARDRGVITDQDVFDSVS